MFFRAGNIASSQNTRKLQCAGRNGQEATSLQALWLCQLLIIILWEKLWRKDYCPGEGRVHKGAEILDKWTSWGRFLVSKCPRSLTMSAVRQLLNWPFWGKLSEASRIGLETRKKQTISPAHVARKHGSLEQAIVKPFAGRPQKEKGELGFRTGWSLGSGLMWASRAVAISAQSHAGICGVSHTWHLHSPYIFSCGHTRCIHYLPQEARRHTGNAKERLCLHTTAAHAGHEHNDCPDGHRPGLPTGGRLLPIVKLSPKFGSCIFHVPRGTLPSFHQKPEPSDFCPVFNFCLIGQGML